MSDIFGTNPGIQLKNERFVRNSKGAQNQSVETCY